jgi:hypothetical protein
MGAWPTRKRIPFSVWKTMGKTMANLLASNSSQGSFHSSTARMKEGKSHGPIANALAPISRPKRSRNVINIGEQ